MACLKPNTNIKKILQNIANDHSYTDNNLSLATIKSDPPVLISILKNTLKDALDTTKIKTDDNEQINPCPNAETNTNDASHNVPILKTILMQSSPNDPVRASDTLKKPNENNLKSIITSRRRQNPRFVGEITAEDFKSSKRALANLHILINTIKKKGQQIRSLQKENEKLRQQADSLSKVMKELRQKKHGVKKKEEEKIQSQCDLVLT